MDLIPLEPRIIPALVLNDHQLVKTRRFADPVYVGDPVNVLSIFNEFEVDEIVLLDMLAARGGPSTRMARLASYAQECFIPLAYGGGLRDVDTIAELFASGFEKAIINSALGGDPAMVRQAVDQFGSQAIVASIDVRTVGNAWRVFLHGGTLDTGIEPVEWAERAAELGVGEILLTSIDREGTYEGFDLDLIRAVSKAVDVPVIAHGGAAKRNQLAEPVRSAGASAVAAGGLFVFQGQGRGVLVNYPSRSQIKRLLDPAAVL